MAKAKSEKPSKVKKTIVQPYKLIILSVFASIASLLFFYYLFSNFYQDRFYPGVKLSGVDLGGKTVQLANQYFSNTFNQRLTKPLILNHQGTEYKIDLSTIDARLDLQAKLDQSYRIGRSENLFLGISQQFQSLILGKNLNLSVDINNLSNLKNQLNQINQKVKIAPKEAQVILDENLTVVPSQDGQQIDSDQIINQIKDYLSFKSLAPETFTIIESKPSFNTTQAGKARVALEQIKDSPIKLSYENQTWLIDQPKLYNLLYQGKPNTEPIWDTSQPDSDPKTTLLLDKTKFNQLIEEVSSKIYQEAHDARFSYDSNSSKVTQFQNAQDGQQLDKDLAVSQIFQALSNPSVHNVVNLPVIQTQAKITTASVNNFGIQGLIGQGRSVFTGSIENRIYNLKLAASRINGVLVAPGETFSFVNTVGDITAATGYKPAYVIKSGRTVLDDGGGVCQSSTTLFRAILNAGLPITERTAHAYRVHFYEDGGFAPGLDATIFYPSVDLKFKNDTPGYILIQAYSQGDNLYVDLYGTPDGRESVVTTPKILSQTPPPPELRQDDPTLPKGTVKQVDWSAWGANVSFSRTVTRNGETLINETFKSIYKPWQAVYLVGTKEG